MKYGLVSVDQHPRESKIARVCVDGVDVSRRCFAANDEEGWADCYVRVDGRYVVTEAGCIARERLRGTVAIDFPRGLD